MAGYGSGRVTWTYEEDRVVGLIECSVMGVEVEIATEAEYALSKNGTIFGVLNSVRLNHLRLPDDLGELKELKPFIGAWPAVEPLLNEVFMDLPFSYQFRLHGDRLVLTNFRMLLAGPSPLGKVGAVLALKDEGPGVVLAAFQALGTAMEGTYTKPDGKEKPARARPPAFGKLRSSGLTLPGKSSK